MLCAVDLTLSQPVLYSVVADVYDEMSSALEQCCDTSMRSFTLPQQDNDDVTTQTDDDDDVTTASSDDNDNKENGRSSYYPTVASK